MVLTMTSCEESTHILTKEEVPTLKDMMLNAQRKQAREKMQGGDGMGYRPTDSLGLWVTEYKQIIIFRDEDLFLAVLEENPHMTALYGTKDHEKELFPGLYIAGFTNCQHSDK